MPITVGPILKYVVIQKVAKATNDIGVLTVKSHICSIQNKKHDGLTNISKNMRGLYKSLTLEPILKYVVIQKVAKATNVIGVLTG